MVSSTPIKNSELFNQSFDKVWGATIATLSEKGFPILTSDKSSGLLSTQPIALQGTFNVPGRIKRVAIFPYIVVPFNDARYSLNIVVLKQTDETTKIVVTPIIEGKNADKGSWVTFQSNGTIEDEIIKAIQDNL